MSCLSGLGVVIQLAVLLHLGFQSGLEIPKRAGSLLGVQKLCFDVLLLLIEIGLIGLLVIGDAVDDPIRAEENGIAGLADRQRERGRILFDASRR